MGEVRLFQICYEGELTVEGSHVMRRLGAEPNFDQSWQVFLPEGRHAAPLVRYLRAQTAPDAKLLVACTQFTTARDFLLVRHSLTPGADYSNQRRTDVNTLGLALGELCPDESLMVTGISHDWAYSDSGASRMFVGDAFEEPVFRSF